MTTSLLTIPFLLFFFWSGYRTAKKASLSIYCGDELMHSGLTLPFSVNVAGVVYKDTSRIRCCTCPGLVINIKGVLTCNLCKAEYNLVRSDILEENK